MTDQIYPVVLCGGSGTRLWPLSRKSYPKQFSPLMGDESLFQTCLKRVSGPAYGAPVIVTADAFRFIVTEQSAAVCDDISAILIEPEGRNTAPAVLAAALALEAKDPDALMLVSPSDHVIRDTDRFQQSVDAGVIAAKSGRLVTFGINPTRPETGYGYLELAASVDESELEAVDLVRFVEKPDEDTAKSMLETGRFLWNGGIFLFSVKTILEAYAEHCPDLLKACRKAYTDAKPDFGFLRLDPDAWKQAEDISIDYAVMERAENLSVVPLYADWSDLGAWDAVLGESEQDESGNALTGPAMALDCENSLLRAEDPNQQLVGVGLQNIAAIAMPDAVLVADMSRTQDVKKVVETLKLSKAKQATEFPRVYRPWGYYETLSLGPRFQVKRIMVRPGALLSLQSHMHRAEHWVVVQGTAKVTNGEDILMLSENQSTYIPLGAIHRLENPGKVDLHLIEVQSGSYLGEDDIVRYEDIYSRT